MPQSDSSTRTRSVRRAGCFLIACLILALGYGTACSQVSFEQNTYPGDYGSNLFAAPADLDEDGWTDMIVTDRANDRLVWLRNSGETEFTEIPIPDTDGYLTYPFIVDLDEDGDLDILGATWTYGEACWFENDGSESFSKHVSGAMPGGHRIIAVDLDEDGDLDMVACGLDSGGNRWFENDGSEDFAEHVLHETRSSHCVDWADFDDDDDIDLVTTDRYSGLVVWTNDGNENFTSELLMFPYAHWVLTDDLDRDGDPDMVGVAYNPSDVSWWENDGAGSFSKHTISSTFQGPLVVDVGDFDEDGDTDVVAAAVNNHEVSWWENDGTQGFTEHPLSSTTYTNAESVQAADLDGDSDVDLVCAGAVDPSIRWFESDIVEMSLFTDLTTGVAPFDVALTDSCTSWYAITDRRWDCDYDGAVDITGADPVWTYDTPGTHSVLLEVWMGARAGRAMLRDHVEVFDTGSALWFDGDGDHVDCPASPASDLTGQFTVEAWISPFDWGGFPMGSYGFGQILEKGSVSLLLTGTHPVRNNHSLYLEMTHPDRGTSGACMPVDAITLDEWQHVAASYDGIGEVRMWLDGVEQTVTYTAAPSGSLAADGAITIGNVGGLLNRTFEGSIDEVRLWNDVREESEIQASMNTLVDGGEQGLVGCWRMDEGNGGVAEDASGGGDGAITGAGWVQGVILDPTSIPEDGSDGVAAGGPTLLSCAPNPFGSSTDIAFVLPRTSEAEVAVYDVSGRAVRRLAGGTLPAGEHRLTWDGRSDGGVSVASGIYFLKLSGPAVRDSRKMVLLR